MPHDLTQKQQAARLRLVDEHVQAENRHDVAGIMETFGQQPTFLLNGTLFPDQESIRALYEGFGFGGQGGFSELQVEVKERHVSEAVIVLEVVLRGKHTRDWQGIAATGQEFKIPACAIFPFDAAGKLAGERVYFDGALLLQQLGAIPSAGPSGR